MTIEECTLLVELLAEGKTAEVDALLQSSGFIDEIKSKELTKSTNISDDTSEP